LTIAKKESLLIYLKQQLLENKIKIKKHDIENKDIIIFGAGNTTNLYQKNFALELLNPICYIDNNKKKWGTIFHGKTVYSPAYLKKNNKQIVLICSANIKNNIEIDKQLEDLSIEHVRIDEYIFSKHIEEILTCAELLENEESLAVYVEILTKRLNNQKLNNNFFSRNQYFILSNFCEMNNNEIFVDMGAYVGDTIESYLFANQGVFKKIYAFEPDVKNYEALTIRIERLSKEWAIYDSSKIITILGGVGKFTQQSYLDQDIKAGSISTKLNEEGLGQPINCYSLDNFFSNQKVTFLKADIESYELDMLQGAQHIICRDIPKMAISIYHGAADLFNIILWINNLNLGYHFSIYHHNNSVFLDTVLYAYI